MRTVFAVAVAAAVLLPGGQHFSAAAAQAAVAAAQEPGGIDPIRCWWQSSAGAITIGESFDVVLTCAVIETASMQVVPDESRLGVASIQMAPFEILGGSHPEEAHRQQRRFFQYHYQLRLISADAIGRDVNVPALAIPYRVHTRVGPAAALEGRDLNYLMPALPIKVLSLVPKEAIDIRDGSDASLGAVESLRLRSSLFQILAIGLGAMAAVMAVIGLIPLARGTRKTGVIESDRLPDRAVASHAARALTDAQAAAAVDGWTDEAVARALASVRVIAALAIRQPVSEKVLAATAPVPEGRLAVSHGRVRTRRASVSSPVTAADVAVCASKLTDGVSLRHRHHLDSLQSALTDLTAALYRQTPTRDAATLNEAVRHAVEVAGDLQRERNAWGVWWSRR